MAQKQLAYFHKTRAPSLNSKSHLLLMWFKFWLNFWRPSVSGCSLLSYFKWPSFLLPSFERHLQLRKQRWLSRWGRGALSIHYLLIEMVKKVNCLPFKTNHLIHMQQPHSKKGTLLGSRVRCICMNALWTWEERTRMREDHPYPVKNLILPILLYCLGDIIDQGCAIKTKTPHNRETKTFNFSPATYLEQTLRHDNKSFSRSCICYCA